MTDPRPYFERPKTEQLDQSASEWQTFSALPPATSLPPVQAEQSARVPQDEETLPKLAPWGKRVGAFALDFGLGLGVSYLAQGLASLVGADAAAVDMTGYNCLFLPLGW
jgi:hypothetical protein